MLAVGGGLGVTTVSWAIADEKNMWFCSWQGIFALLGSTKRRGGCCCDGVGLEVGSSLCLGTQTFNVGGDLVQLFLT